MATDWRLLALGYGIGLLLLSLRAALGGVPLLQDPDDALRLVQVRDLLSGQSWYDLTQYRLDPPEGVPMHWSRLADLPVAGLVLLLSPLVGMAMAETAAIWSYPLLLLGGLLWLSHRLALRLGGREAGLAGIVLALFSLVGFTEFAPGRIDHHGLQLLLALGMLLALLAALQRPALALVAAVCGVVALAIGIESLPAVISGIAAAGIIHALWPGHGRLLQWLGAGLAGSAMLGLATRVAPAGWTAAHCDAFSAPYALALVAGGLGLWLLGLPRLWVTGALPRLAMGAGVAGAVLLLVGLTFPQCLAGPYGGLDPYVVSHWLARVEEARPALAVLLRDPVHVLAPGVPALLALGIAIRRIGRGERTARPGWTAYLVFLCMALLVGLLQVRGLKLAGLLAVPGSASLVAEARAAYLERQSLPRIAALLACWLVSCGMVVALLAGVALPPAAAPTPAAEAGGRSTGAGATACISPAAYAELAALPPRRLLAPLDLGGHLLLYTPHAVVGAPYHRNQRGIIDTLQVFHGQADAARALLAARGITELVLCRGLPELRPLPDSAPDAVVRQIAAGSLPGWLQPLGTGSGLLQRYRVVAPRGLRSGRAARRRVCGGSARTSRGADPEPPAPASPGRRKWFQRGFRAAD